MRLHKPVGIFLLLWPTLWALWIAGEGKPNLLIVSIFVLGVIIMRSAGCVINDIADAKFDKFVERTKERPLASGKLTIKQAKILFAILITSAFLLVLTLNHLTVMLAVIGAALAVFYPYMKRFTHLPQLGLGIAFAWGVPMAFAALLNTVPAKAWILFSAAAIWPVIYDTMYAMVDKNDDVTIGIKSTAILLDRLDLPVLAFLQLIFLLLLYWSGRVFQLQPVYFFSIGAAAILCLYQQWLIRDRVPTRCFQAFLNNQRVGLIIFIGIVMSYLL